MKLSSLPDAGRSALKVLSKSERPGAAFEDTWRASVKRRVVVMVCFMAIWASAVEARFFYLQVVDHQWLLAEAEARQERLITDKAKRGDIVDRNGQVLAYSVEADTIFAVPTSITDPQGTTDAICRVLADCSKDVRATLLDRLSSKKSFQYVRRQITPEQAAEITALKLEGVGLRTETKRFYPKKELASHILGFTDIDSGGLAGVERTFNSRIGGVDGKSLVQMDAKGRSVQSVTEEPTTPGATVELTIDQYVQYITERELQAGVERAGAKSGTAIVMDPMSGEILAMASYPTFNPNTKGATDEERRNRALQDVYEPGSTFKIVTTSAAFEEGILKPDDMIDTHPGRISFGSRVIGEAKHADHGVLSVKDVVVESSNVGAVKIGLKVGAERMDKYIRRFGFGQLALKDKDLPGESRGVVWDATKLSDSSLASMSMGYEVSVTPLQMVTAVSSVANGGILYQPHIVRAVVENSVRRPVPPKEVQRSINPDTAATLTDIMEGVVLQGTGKTAKVDGYQVAGKTGTAAKLVGEPGHLVYSKTDYNCSFVGFVPSRQPRLAIIVVIDTPRKLSPYGGTVAAPVFQKIADATLRQLGVPRTINPVAPVLVTSAATTIKSTDTNPPVVPALTNASGESLVPDVRGLSAREATRLLTRAGLTARLAGTGVVDTQLPEAGAPLERGTTIALQLRRHGENR